MKQILILNHSFKSPFKEIDLQYARVFPKNAYAVTRVYLTGQPENAEALHPDIAETIFLNLSKKDIRGLKRTPIRIVTDIAKQKNIVFAVCHRYKPAYIMFWVAKALGIPLFVSVMHDFNVFCPVNRKGFAWLALRRRCVFAGVSDAIRDDIFSDLWGVSPQQVITLPNTLDVDEIVRLQFDNNQARRQMGMGPDDFIVGTAGRLHPVKDHLTLIRALALIRDRCPAMRLVIMGTGPLQADIQQELRRLGLENRVRLMGFVPRASAWMTGFDVYVSPSRKEPFGMVLLEAMAASCPIIATAVDGVPGVVGDAGALVPPGNPEILATVMRDYYEMPADRRRVLGEQAKQRLIDHFTTESLKKAFQGHAALRPFVSDHHAL